MTDDPFALAGELVAALRALRCSCATAESCTGGMVAAAITSIAGSSEVFERGFVTYSNSAKTEMLDVPAAVIRAHGAVSEAVARAMATGALAKSPAQVSVAVTGVAGPGGGTPAKPVGMVCFAWARRGVPARAETRHFAGDRAEVRRLATLHALSGLLMQARESPTGVAH